MGINSNGLKLGGPVPAQANYQGRSGASPGAVRDDQAAQSDQAAQASATTAPSAGSASANPAGKGSAGSGSTAAGGGQGGSAAASGSQGTPSAQTRSARASRAVPKTAPAQAAAVATNGQAATATVDTDADASGDFGSVMATALGRSASQAPSAAAPAAKAGAPAGVPAATAATDPATSAPAGDAVAWIAQVMMPPTTPQPKAAAAGQDAATATAIASRTAAPGIGAVTTAADDSADDPQVAGADTQPALAAGQSATVGAAAFRRGRTDTLSATNGQPTPLSNQAIQTTQTTQTADDASVPTPAGQAAASGDANALADVQARIAGLSAPAAATDVDAGRPAVGTTHAAPTAAATDASQAAAALQATAIGRTSAAGEATLTIKAAVGSTAFANEVGSGVTGLAQSGITQAQLQLNPADLGPVQVHITMQSGQASVWFGATHADTRAALEQSLPRLRELFTGAGMSLSDSGVFREPPQQRQAQSAVTAGAASLLSAEQAAGAPVTQVSNVRLALLDTYA